MLRLVRQPARARVAERLCGLAPVDDPRVFLTSGGGDSIDTAAKLARRYFAAIGSPERVHLISRSQGYHGTHGTGTSLGGIPANRVDVGPLDPHSSQVPHDSLEALEAEIERVGADRVAAVVRRAGDRRRRRPPSRRPGYLEGIDALCKRTGVLHIVDAVIAGFGRIGEWFGPERWGLRPEMITFAEGVTSGYLPLGGVIVNGTDRGAVLGRGRRAVVPPRADPTRATRPAARSRWPTSTSSSARACSPARSSSRARSSSALTPFESHALVGEVRCGTGALGAVALSAEVLGLDAKAPFRVFNHARERGCRATDRRRRRAVAAADRHVRAHRPRPPSAIGEALDAVASELGVTAAA